MKKKKKKKEDEEEEEEGEGDEPWREDSTSLKLKTEDEKHEVKADNVTGIKGGPLMCDTQHENSKYKSSKRTRA